MEHGKIGARVPLYSGAGRRGYAQERNRMKLLEDGTLVVETAEKIEKINRVIVLQEGTHYCGVYYQEQGEE